MGRAPCCDKANVKRGPWSPEEDTKLKDYIEQHGTGGNWIALPQKAGLRRCGKSCRLRWLNYLRPNLKHGEFSDDEDRIICTLFANIGSRWSIIAAQLPGRTDNDIKNYWNTKLKKKLMSSYYINPVVRTGISSAVPDHHHHFGSFSTAIPSNSPASQDFYELSPFNSSPSSSATANLQPQDRTTLFGLVNVYGREASCSSSDGSTSRDQYNHQQQQQQMPNNSVEAFSSSHYQNEIPGPGYQEIANYGSSTTPMGYYGIEEIKQLISSSSSSSSGIPNIINNNNNNNCNYSSFLFENENKTTANVASLASRAEEGFLYYY